MSAAVRQTRDVRDLVGGRRYTRAMVRPLGLCVVMSLSCRAGQPEQGRELEAPTASAPALETERGEGVAPPAPPSARAAASPQRAASSVAPAPAPEPEEKPPVRRALDTQRDRTTSGQQRMDAAVQEKLPVVKQLFSEAGVGWPPLQLLMRGFKKENRLELWAADALRKPLTHVTTYEICYASGKLGPKRQEGDHQVPEGFYDIVWFKAKSDYHLSMQVSYPNTSDRVLGHPRQPGGEIMIHGDCVSVGCLAMSDERIEEIWVIARAAPRPVDVHLFPTRDMQGLLAQNPDSPHHAFWSNLKEGFDRFESTRLRFNVRVKMDGRYQFFDR